MAEKNLNARIIHKHDTEENWLKSSFIPKQGEIIIYDIDSSHSYERIKVGDGTTNVNNLPFAVIGKHGIGNNAEIFNDYLNNTASGNWSHAEGYNTFASGTSSHVEGDSCKSIGPESHAEGLGTVAEAEAQHVQGKFNISDEDWAYSHIVGNGTSDSVRSNAHTLDWSGNGWFAGDIYVGSTSGTNKDEGSKKLATEEYVTTALVAITNDEIDTICGATIEIAEDVTL